MDIYVEKNEELEKIFNDILDLYSGIEERQNEINELCKQAKAHEKTEDNEGILENIFSYEE